MFNLPQGYIAEVLWHRDLGDTCYEFDQVYGPDGRLDEARSFWLVTPLDQETPVVMDRISYGAYKTLYGRDACSSGEFSSPSQPPGRIHRWLERMHALTGQELPPTLSANSAGERWGRAFSDGGGHHHAR
jgi:hypothetical protein